MLSYIRLANFNKLGCLADDLLCIHTILWFFLQMECCSNELNHLGMTTQPIYTKTNSTHIDKIRTHTPIHLDHSELGLGVVLDGSWQYLPQSPLRSFWLLWNPMSSTLLQVWHLLLYLPCLTILLAFATLMVIACMIAMPHPHSPPTPWQWVSIFSNQTWF